MKDKASVLIIGGGYISKFLEKKLINSDKSVIVFKMRDLIPFRISLKNIDFSIYDQIIFCAYDHFSVLNNVLFMKRCVDRLNQSNFKGQFIYLNTQGLLLDKIAEETLKSHEVRLLDPYILSKSLQSRALSKLHCGIVQIYLPAVTGMKNSFDLQLYRISISPKVILPNQGNNKFFFLSIGNLVNYIDDMDILLKNKNVFLYDNYNTLVDYVGAQFNYCSGNEYSAYNYTFMNHWKFVVKKFIIGSINIFLGSFRRRNLIEDINFDECKDIPLLNIGPEAYRAYSLNFYIRSGIPDIQFKKVG